MTTTTSIEQNPPACLQSMGCLCWAHAIGASLESVCFTGELAPFGKEQTANEYRLRAQWEAVQAEDLAKRADAELDASKRTSIGFLVDAHRFAARTYERQACKLEGSYTPPAWSGGLDKSIPAGVKLAWGARAIYKLATERVKHGRGHRERTIAIVDILHDRQEMTGGGLGQSRERKDFSRWINQEALPQLKSKLAESYVLASSGDVITWASEGYAIIASPRSSFGYLYMVAWKVPS